MVKRNKSTMLRSLVVCLSVLALCLAVPALAFAEEAAVTEEVHGAEEAYVAEEVHAAEEGHDSGGGFKLLLPNMGEFIPMLVGFAILMFALMKFGWPIIIDMLEQRVNTIQNDLEQAEASRLETAELLEEQRKLLADARVQAVKIVDEAKQAAEAARIETETKAAEQAEAMLANARSVIEHEKNQAMLELMASIADITVTLAGRLIGDDLNEAEHRRIIETYIAQAGSFDVG